jgi:hypothetical protein
MADSSGQAELRGVVKLLPLPPRPVVWFSLTKERCFVVAILLYKLHAGSLGEFLSDSRLGHAIVILVCQDMSLAGGCRKSPSRLASAGMPLAAKPAS